MNKTVTITVKPGSAEYAAQSIGILASGLSDAFSLSLDGMNNLTREEMQDWFSRNYDNLNGGLACINILSGIIADVLEDMGHE